MSNEQRTAEDRGTSTQGPWTISPAGPGYRAPGEDDAKDMQIITSDGMSIGVVWDGVAGSLAAEQKANARLIMSAPDMLEALERIVSEGDFTAPEGMKRIARIAIAKATGVQQS